jgi:hypothetical protein
MPFQLTQKLNLYLQDLNPDLLIVSGESTWIRHGPNQAMTYFEDSEISVQSEQFLNQLHFQKALEQWKNISPSVYKILANSQPSPEHLALAKEADLILCSGSDGPPDSMLEQIFLSPEKSQVVIQTGPVDSYQLIETNAGEIHFEKRVWNHKFQDFEIVTDKSYFLKNQWTFEKPSVHAQFL